MSFRTFNEIQMLKTKHIKRDDKQNEVGTQTNMSDILNNLLFPKCFHWNQLIQWQKINYHQKGSNVPAHMCEKQ